MEKTKKIAALTLRRMNLDELNNHPRNAEIRLHPQPGTQKWEALKKSLSHDYFDPIVYNKRNGFLVSGHLRKKVLLSMGYTHADVAVVDYDEPTHLCRMIAANKSIGDEISEGLESMMEGLKKEGVDLSLTTFTDKDLDELRKYETSIPNLHTFSGVSDDLELTDKDGKK